MSNFEGRKGLQTVKSLQEFTLEIIIDAQEKQIHELKVRKKALKADTQKKRTQLFELFCARHLFSDVCEKCQLDIAKRECNRCRALICSGCFIEDDEEFRFERAKCFMISLSIG
jgi:hypothetical protein